MTSAIAQGGVSEVLMTCPWVLAQLVLIIAIVRWVIKLFTTGLEARLDEIEQKLELIETKLELQAEAKRRLEERK